MTNRRLLLIVAILTLNPAASSQAGDGDTFSVAGPSPYTGIADSPYAATGGFSYCVETFENGKLDVPGVTGNGGVVGPGGNIDSVDADDGTIDGSGTSGHSYFSGDGTTGISFTFDENRTNGLPTRVAIVWTDGGGAAPVFFQAFSPMDEGTGLLGPFLHADLSNNGETAEDRVYGVSFAPGISKITISNTGGGIEVDHLQLDRCVLCGDANADLQVLTADALTALRTSVGATTCLVCRCDANNSTTITTSDALAILRKSVGSEQVMNCPACNFVVN